MTCTTPGPENDFCLDAIALRENVKVQGTLVGATSDDGVGRCGDASASVGPGVWYTFRGKLNARESVKVCTDGSFDVQVTVVGSSCRIACCVNGGRTFSTSYSANSEEDPCAHGVRVFWAGFPLVN